MPAGVLAYLHEVRDKVQLQVADLIRLSRQFSDAVNKAAASMGTLSAVVALGGSRGPTGEQSRPARRP